MKTPAFEKVLGAIPTRMAFAGGWIDQPFVSRRHPDPPGSMVVASMEANFPIMDRCGMATSTRKVAEKLWGEIPRDRDPAELVKELYATENDGQPDPSGSQDMIGLIYPGVSRLDYDFAHESGLFPVGVESNNDPVVARWLESVLSMIPVCPRPEAYSPLGVKKLDPEWIRRLGRTGRDCFDAIVSMDAATLGASMNECMICWEKILPHTVNHPALTVDLKAILAAYQSICHGAMYSGCGGGYLYVVSEEPLPGGIRVSVRTDPAWRNRT